ncbi:MAG: hypothetical protein AB2L14_00950 [Candidatus Xenobiia bacterium LiM19]
MLILAYYLISLCCGNLENNLGYLNVTRPLLTKVVLFIFSPSPIRIVVVALLGTLLSLACCRYNRYDDPLHSFIVITVFANSLVIALFSVLAAAFIVPFYFITGSPH